MATRAVTIPAQYAKFITALLGEGIAYIQLYGTTWHLQPALVMLGAALAVLGVPNAQPPIVLKPAQPEDVTMTSIGPVGPVDPATGRTPPPPARLTP